MESNDTDTGQSNEVTNTEAKKNLIDLFIEDFEIQYQKSPFEKESKEELKRRTHVLFCLYTIDFLLSHLIAGMSADCPGLQCCRVFLQGRALWQCGGQSGTPVVNGWMMRSVRETQASLTSSHSWGDSLSPPSSTSSTAIWQVTWGRWVVWLRLWPDTLSASPGALLTS